MKTKFFNARMDKVFPGRNGILAILAFCLASLLWTARASDHADMPLLAAYGRQDARITDLYAFTRHNKLVLILCLNPAVPPSTDHYVFSTDLVARFHIDAHTPVSFNDPTDLGTFGGTILQPGRISEDVLIEVSFDANNEPVLNTEGLKPSGLRQLTLFAGLTDDPFIRGPREGRNVAAIALELPLESVLHDQSTLLIWGTTKVPDVQGPIADHVGRALRSMFPESDVLNTLRPRDHFKIMGMVPDVILFDTSRPALFPNGRDLPDDIMDMVGDPRVMINDAPFPSENDLPFQEAFPYLAWPHPPR